MDFLLRPLSSHDSSVIHITPTAGFVIKSKLEYSKDASMQLGTKIFINICYDEKVPPPDVDFVPSTVYTLIMDNKWEIPIVTSSVREDVDKKGAPCYVWDCCINQKCMQWILEDYQLREIVVEWCLESCELRQDVGISRDSLTFPRLKSKGKIPPLELLSADLKEDFQKEVELLERGLDDPQSLLTFKREQASIDEGASISIDNGSLPPLFPTDRIKSKKPTIEELDSSSFLIKSNAASAQPDLTKQLHTLDYSVTMGKPVNTSKYKLKIEVASPMTSAEDYLLQYDTEDNALVLANTNTHIYRLETLNIPLPAIFAGTEHFASFFVRSQQKLVIFM